MRIRRLGRTLVALGIAVATGCAFDPRGAEVEPVDAPTIDAVDAAALDAADAPAPRDATDAPLPLDACVPDPLGERCNGLDDDCDLAVDEDYPALGAPCDGPDADLCLDDAVACDPAGATTVCANPAPDDDLERCNGLDDDCDLATDEDFPTLGAACDGADGDLCREGSWGCAPDGAGVSCTDTTATTAEACNGLDDDCDLAIDEDFPTLGAPCDGADGDACPEGMIECDPSGTVTRCGDLTGTLVEVCNATDDDCDLEVDETFDLTSDLANCGGCGRQCSNPFGTTTCAASACAPTCSAGANDCDGDPNTGCEPRDTNPACAAATALGTVRGDAGADALTAAGYHEAFFEVQVTETVTGGGGDIDAQVTLVSPPGTNFDLYVTCLACGGATVSSATTGTDTVNLGRTDGLGTNSYPIRVEVRWVSAAACGSWALTVTGNVDTANTSCGP